MKKNLSLSVCFTGKFVKNRNVLIVLFLFIASFYSSTAYAQTLRILSYNIHHGCDTSEKLQLQNMADLIRKSNVDIVGLEEVDSVCKRSENTDQAKILGKLTGMHYVFVRHFAFEGGSYGLALLSKYPISDLENNRLPVLTQENGNTRAFLTATLHVPHHKKILVGVAHLDYRDDSSRVHQSAIILNMFKDKKMPVLLLGDLNAAPESKAVLRLKELFTDANRTDYKTFPAGHPREKIDYILVNKDHYLKTIDEPFYDVLFSDHFPIGATIEIK
ncbi:MAG: endonuclease/exonuclease/phosphatase family protein [Ginsengibacter sp.]